MKLINYRYGCVMNKNSTWYNGKIKMSYTEFVDVVKFLKRKRLLGASYYSDMNKQLLKEDLQKKQECKNGFLVALRVTCTELIAEKYKLTNYKRNNYFIEVNTK